MHKNDPDNRIQVFLENVKSEFALFMEGSDFFDKKLPHSDVRQQEVQYLRGAYCNRASSLSAALSR